MNRNTGCFFLLLIILIIPLCNKGYAEESTFEIRHKNENKGYKKAVIGFLDNQEQKYLKEALRLTSNTNKVSSNRNESAKFKGFRDKGLNILLKIEDIKAQMNGSIHTTQIQGIRKLLYIMIFTDEGTSAVVSFNKIRYQTIILTSENILKLARLQAGIYEETRMPEEAEKMYKELINDINNPKHINESALKNQRL